MMHVTAHIRTPLGIATICDDYHGVKAISLSNDTTALDLEIPACLRDAVSQLHEYFEGTRGEFTFPLNPAGTDFQLKVWTELRKIPFGKTMTYAELSHKLGDIKAIRAVASANGKNPLWIVIPCHRVIGTDGSLTGYAGGLWRKKWLLEHENPSAQQSLF